jgi:thiamine transport system substrate-binding protein
MKRLYLMVAVLGIAAAACGSGGGSKQPVTLTLITHDSFTTSPGILEAFTAQTGIKVTVAKGQDAGVVVSRAILTKDDPEGDVLWGVDNTLIGRTEGQNVFENYTSKAADIDPAIASSVRPDATPVDQGYVCVNYDKAWFANKKITPPTSLADLTDPKYKNLLVVENPATSSPGLAFMYATIDTFGDQWQSYWKDLRANGVKVVDGWTTAYNVDFSGSAGKGDRPLVVSYSTSPAAEVVYGDPKPADAPTGSLTKGCFAQIEYAAILKGTKHEKEAQQLVDFFLSKQFQEDMPLNMFVYPVRTDAAVPPEFTQFSPKPSELLLVPKDATAQGQQWIDEWTNAVLR